MLGDQSEEQAETRTASSGGSNPGSKRRQDRRRSLQKFLSIVSTVATQGSDANNPTRYVTLKAEQGAHFRGFTAGEAKHSDREEGDGATNASYPDHC